MKIKNKILIILAIIVASLFICSVNSYAFAGTNCNGETLEMPDFASLVENVPYYFVYVYEGKLNLITIDYLQDGSKCTYLTYGGFYLINVNSQYRIDSTNNWYLYRTLDSGMTITSVNISDYSSVYYSNFDIIDSNNLIYYSGSPLLPEAPTVETPTIMNSSTTWDTGIYDYIVVYSNDLIGESWQDFYLLAYDYSSEDTAENLSIYPKKVIPLENGTSSPYYTSTSEDYGYVFYIPTSSLGLTFNNNHNYALKLAFKKNVDYEGEQVSTYDYFYTYKFTVANLTEEEIIQNKQDVMNSLLEEQQEILKEQNEAIKEQTETSKGIWGTLKEVVSYLNPLSDNFFVFKLIDLLIDALKSLFIPSTEYFSNWFTDLNDSFADQFGILYYPISVIIDFLGSLDDVLQETEPIIKTPEFTLCFMGFSATLLPAIEYNFNDLLANATFANVHKFYLFFVNVIFTVGLIAFCSKVATEIFGGVDDSVNSYMDNTYEADMQRYVRYQNVKRSYHLNKNQNLRNMRRRNGR